MDTKTAESRAHYTPRLEDDPLVRGLGRFAADVPLDRASNRLLRALAACLRGYPLDRHGGRQSAARRGAV